MESILSTIIGALIGSFSAAAFTYYHREKQNRQILKINCRLLLDETLRHQTLLDQEIIINDKRLRNIADAINLEIWDDLKTKLPGINFLQFNFVREHFKNMKDIKKTIESSEHPTPIPEDLLVAIREICATASETLFVICYDSKK